MRTKRRGYVLWRAQRKGSPRADGLRQAPLTERFPCSWRTPSSNAIFYCATFGAVAVSFALPPWPQCLFGAVFGVLAVRIAREDLAFMIVPDADVALLFVAGLAAATLGTAANDPVASGGWAWDGARLAVARAVIAGGAAYVLSVAYRLVRGREGLGLGDVKLVAAAAAWLPLTSALHAVTLAAVAALLVSLVRAFSRGEPMSGTKALPFAAFLAPAFWIIWLGGAAELS